MGQILTYNDWLIFAGLAAMLGTIGMILREPVARQPDHESAPDGQPSAS